MPSMQGTLVAVKGKGVLLTGVPGSGKSDLALCLVDGGGKLVTDDLVALKVVAGRVYGSLPSSGAHLAGMIELRGIGLVQVAFVEAVTIDLVVELTSPVKPRGDNLESEERLSPPRTVEIEGVAVRAIALHAFEASAPARIRAVLTGGIMGGTVE